MGLVGNRLGEGLLVIQRDLDGGDAIILRPRVLAFVFPISWSNQNAIERQRSLDVQSDVFADAIALRLQPTAILLGTDL
jgi:hypothetical protein